MNEQFFIAVTQAAHRPEVRSAVREIYQLLQTEIDLRRPVCKQSGRCCHFDEYGHRLYVTTAEMAVFFAELPEISHSSKPASGSIRSLPILKEPGCPFQIDGLCSVHEIRPFGCRIFFCDETSTDWQREQYERFHQQLKQIHERLEIPYFYMEWRQALAAMRLPPGKDAATCAE